MKKSRLLTYTALACATLFTNALSASNLRWLDYSPSRYFTNQDWDIAKAAARNALDNTENGVTVEWENPESKNHGKLTPLNSSEKNGTTCRDLKIENFANTISASNVYEFCKRPDGTWKANDKR